MDDLVERLRDTKHHPWEICQDAADEITRLHIALAASQAREAKLRNLLRQASCWIDLDQMDGGYQLGKKIEATLNTTDDTALREMIATAVSEEREACAKLVEEQDSYGDYVGGWFEILSAKIRARK